MGLSVCLSVLDDDDGDDDDDGSFPFVLFFPSSLDFDYQTGCKVFFPEFPKLKL